MTDKIQVLFVDDDANILSGLKRMMRARKDECDAWFCQAGEEALALMATQPMDVVVSDMRMPVMDGAELLSTVRKRHPATIRVILSGYADAECVLRTVGPAHVYLAKPCQADAVMAAISRPLALRRLLGSERLREALAGLINLPTPPELFFQLESELSSPRASSASVAAIISRDVAMTAELLKLTNSAYFSTNSQATTPLQAVRTLGMEIIEALVLRIGLFRQLDRDSTAAPMMEALNGYSLQVAALAERIAEAEGGSAPIVKAAYCAGMLSSVGSLVFLDSHALDYAKARLEIGQGIPLHEWEETMFGASHALVGAYLLGLWGFADIVVEAVAHSCAPSACVGRDNPVLTAVHAARALGPRFPLLAPQSPSQPKLDMAYICDARKDLRIAHWRELSTSFPSESAHA